MRMWIWLAAMAVGLGPLAFAANDSKPGQTKIKIEDAKEKKNTVSGDIDEEITNAKLRAESGSKSRWSASFSANYYGASLEKPLDKDRPNPTRDPVPQQVRMSGDISGRFRFNKSTSVNFGTGFSLQRPLQEAKRGDLSNPYVAMNYVSRIGKVQNIATAALTIPTMRDDLLVGTMASVAVADTMMYDFNGSPFSLGLAGEIGYTFYRDMKDQLVSLQNRPAIPAGYNQEDYGFAVYPLAEYAFSDRIQLRTVFRPWIYGHSPFRSGFTMYKRPWTQSIGMGFAVTRDIYLYPNFQFAWETWRGDDFNWFRKNTRSTSTVGLAATVNLF